MILVTARVEIDPATVAALKGAIAAMERASRAEPGCIDYVFTTEINDPSVVRIVERWRSMDALREHFATAHMATFNKAMAASPPKSIDVKVFEVEKELKLPGSSREAR